MSETASQIRQRLVDRAISFLGCKESDGSHRKIIDLYNSHKPLAQGYKLTYTDAWCDGFASACAIAEDLTDIIPTEVGCGRHIALFQKLGRWVENDAYVPSPGDYIFYDWQDSGSGDNTGGPDHVGIVVSVSGNTIRVIEGNKNDAVGYRDIAVNGRYIRGYGVPDFESKAAASGASTPAAPAIVLDEKGIWDFLHAKLGNPYGVAAVMGNLYAESGLHADNLENTGNTKLGLSDAEYTAAVDSGSYTNFVRDSHGYGLAQWTFWSRKQGLLDYAKANGATIGDATMQLQYLMKELAESYSSVLSALKSAKTVREASDSFMTKFEVPADQSDNAKAKRAGYGQVYFDKYSGSGATSAQQKPSVNYGPVCCSDPELHQLSEGCCGPEVKTVQRILRACGINGSDGKDIYVDGEFGPITAYAVRTLQGKLGILQDALVGKITWGKLLRELN